METLFGIAQFVLEHIFLFLGVFVVAIVSSVLIVIFVKNESAQNKALGTAFAVQSAILLAVSFPYVLFGLMSRQGLVLLVVSLIVLVVAVVNIHKAVKLFRAG